MALTTDQLKHLSLLYDRWQRGDASLRDAVQREVSAADADVARAFAQMVANSDTDASATLLPPISPAMREAAVLAARPSNADNTGGASNAHASPFSGTLSGDMPTREAGQHVGPYRLIKELGRGGMGVVWLAERADGTHARQVALKMPLVENLNWLLAARFARERNILASLEHPSIARLYDAGVDEHAQPYIAIEYVAGLPITQYVLEKKLKPEAIVQRFTKVIEAVAHAHAQLVIHRDIKPTNILVDAKGEPHLLDFGIAKLLDDDESMSADATQLTRLSGRALTLDYASPEQVNNVPLGTASDVYSLGIVLYELLTGSRPYHPKGPTRRDLELAILEQDPGKPSELLLRTGDSEAGKSARSVRGDLDTIVLKALKKDPMQRYATAQAFADDLKRYIAFEPVTAKPDSEWYRVARFVRRNRVGVGVALALGAAIAAGVTSTVWQASIAKTQAARANAEALQKEREAERANAAAAEATIQAQIAAREAMRADLEAAAARNDNARANAAAADALLQRNAAKNQTRAAQTESLRAQREAGRAELAKQRALSELNLAEAMNSLMDVFFGTDAEKPLDKAEMVQRGEAMVDKKFANEPRTRAFMLHQLGTMSANAHRLDHAAELYQRASAAATTPDSLGERVVAECRLGGVHIRRGEYKLARVLIDAAIDLARRSQPNEPALLVDCLHQRAYLNRSEGNPESMLADVSEALRLIGRPRAGQFERVRGLRELRASGNAALGRIGDAVREYEQVLAEIQGSGEVDAATAPTSARNSYGILLMRAGQSARAAQVLEPGIARATNTDTQQGLDIPYTVNFANALSDVGRFSEALPLFDRVLAVAERSGNARSIGEVSMIAAEGRCTAGDAARCEPLIAQSAAALNRIHPATDPVFPRLDMIRGQLALLKKQPKQAREYLQKAHATLTATGRPEPRHVRVLTYLALAEVEADELDAALAHAKEAVAMGRERDKDFPASERVGSALVVLGKAQKAKGDAAAARASFAEALTQLETAVGVNSPKANAARQLVAEI